jgi:hypothetical protein
MSEAPWNADWEDFEGDDKPLCDSCYGRGCLQCLAMSETMATVYTEILIQTCEGSA